MCRISHIARRLSLLLGALLLAACPAWAQAPGTYAVGTSADCNTSALSVTITVPVNSLVVAWGVTNVINDTLTVSDSASQTYTAATVAVSNSIVSAGVTAQVFYKAGSSALTSVTLKSGTATTPCTMSVAAYPNMATASAVDVQGIQSNTTTSTSCPSPSVTTTNASDVIVGFCTDDASLSHAAGGTGCTYTLGVNDTVDAPDSALQDCNSSATGAFQSSIGLSSSKQSIGAIVAFKQAPSCSPTGMLMGVERC